MVNNVSMLCAMCVRAPVFSMGRFQINFIYTNNFRRFQMHVSSRRAKIIVDGDSIQLCVYGVCIYVRCACVPPKLHIHLTTKNVFVRYSRLSHRLHFCGYFYGIGSFRPPKLLTSPTHKCRPLPIITFNILMPIRHSSPFFVIHETSFGYALYSLYSVFIQFNVLIHAYHI